ncbi:hypothetical protein [Rufibacter psychrotolerans]|uniref:hypothetical protein n=1 Tax=Rufibacter psychrotolerans TaxID=2812556 RepID=UPI001967133B|nr:hypothetical protein [Rufibacter sp. SYSU D00308]
MLRSSSTQPRNQEPTLEELLVSGLFVFGPFSQKLQKNRAGIGVFEFRLSFGVSFTKARRGRGIYLFEDLLKGKGEK